MLHQHFSYFFEAIIFILALTCSSHGHIRTCKSGEHPSAVAIVNTQTKISSCSGAIISDKLVVTLAQCMMLTTKLDEFIIIAGIIRIDISTIDNAQVRKIQFVLRYPQPKVSEQIQDLALIQTNQPFTFNNKVMLVSIAPLTSFEIDQQCELVGWKLSTPEKTPNVLAQETLRVAPCPVTHTLPILENITVPIKNQFCGTNVGDKPEECVGDSGSPLYCGKKLRGLLLGGACRAPGYSIHFQNVAHYAKWIERMTMEQKRALRSCANVILFSLHTFGLILLVYVLTEY